MSFESALIHRLEAADAQELAHLIAGATADEERVLRVHLGDERFRRMRERVVRKDLTRRKRAAQGNVVVIHGIMGGELSGSKPGDDELLWVSIPRVIIGGLSRLRLAADGVTDATAGWTVHATGMLKKYYGDLLLWLAADWNVKPFFYDWRKNLDLAAADLNDRIVAWFGKGAPVHLVAHSMGGLVSRTFIANHEDTWKGMWDERSGGRLGGRLVMLGTPNHGSFAIPQVITGLEELVRKIERADLAHDLADLQQIFNSFPGSLEMLPSPFKYDSLRPLYDSRTYGLLGISQSQLTAALDHHAKLRTVIEPDRMSYIAGYNQPTFSYVDPTLEAMSDLRRYAVTKDGDGRVPHILGLLDKVTTYYVETDHGGLSEETAVFSVISDLLERGKSEVVPTKLPGTRASRGAEGQDAIRGALLAKVEAQMMEVEALAAGRRSRGTVAAAGVTEEDRRAEELILRGLLGDGTGLGRNTAPVVVSAGAKSVVRSVRVGVRLVMGSIGSVDGLGIGDLPVDAIAVGHYIGVSPQAAEKVIDDALTAGLARTGDKKKIGYPARGVIAQFTERGILRGALGEPFFLNDPRGPKLKTGSKTGPRLIALVGLGQPGHLGVPELTVAVRELCWSLGLLGKQHLATVLIGAGPGNLSIPDAVNGWVRGIRRALVEGGTKHAGLRRITFVEWDPARIEGLGAALELERNRQRNAGLEMELQLPTDGERKRWQAQRRKIQSRDRAADTRTRPNGGGDAAPTVVTVSSDTRGYVFAALTENASVPERAVAIDHALVLEANQRLAGAGDTAQQRSLGRTLLNLIVPEDLRPHLRSSAPLVMVVDATTARLHWEMMSDGEMDGDATDAFLATGRGFTRRLRTAFAAPPEPPPPAARTLRALVVADPVEEARLPGAALEGMQVADLFETFNRVYADTDHRVEVTRLFGPQEATRLNVLMALTQGRYDVLHFAGHCIFDPENADGSGWIFSGGTRLTARELNRIDRIPPFIFSNACESGITPERAAARPVAAAPSFAEAFFARGVGNFICTAWEVDDAAALVFATGLYRQLLGLQDSQPAQDGQDVRQGGRQHGRQGGSQGGRQHGKKQSKKDNRKEGKGRFATLAEALRAARSSIFDQGGGVTTWGAYQHYGTPAYRFFEAQSERGR